MALTKVFCFYCRRLIFCWAPLGLFGIETTVRKKPMPEFKHPRPKFISFCLCKCPRCGNSDVFKYSIFNIFKFSDTNLSCANCKLTYEPEPGFFFGAMYWSYAFIVALIVTLSIAFSVFNLFDYAIYAIPVILILLLPPIFRYSRMMMLYVVYPNMYKSIFSEK